MRRVRTMSMCQHLNEENSFRAERCNSDAPMRMIRCIGLKITDCSGQCREREMPIPEAHYVPAPAARAEIADACAKR